jgi:hypothetical protein
LAVVWVWQWPDNRADEGRNALIRSNASYNEADISCRGQCKKPDGGEREKWHKKVQKNGTKKRVNDEERKNTTEKERK